jgi:hypothetical protein
VCQFSTTNNCFYSDLYEKNDSAKLAIPFNSFFRKENATFAHASKPPFATGFTGQGQAERAPLGFEQKIRLRPVY